MIPNISTRFSAQTPKVAIISDIDNSLVVWKNVHEIKPDEAHLDDAIQTLVDLSGETVQMASTARSPSLVRLLGSLLSRIPFVAVMTNNGQQFLRPAARPSGNWLNTLSLSDQDPHYAQTTHWPIDRFHQILAQIAQRLNFTEPQLGSNGFNHKPCWQIPHKLYQVSDQHHAGQPFVQAVLDQSSLMLWPQKEGGLLGELQKVDQEFLQQLQALISERLYTEGLPHHVSGVHFPDSGMIDISPIGVDKGSAAQYALTSSTPGETKAVITVDDNKNGESLLAPHQYMGADGRPILNFPIVVGHKLQELNTHPRLMRVQTGQLGAALRQQFDRASKVK